MLIKVTARCGRPGTDCGAMVLLTTPETPQTRFRTMISYPSAGALSAITAALTAAVISLKA